MLILHKKRIQIILSCLLVGVLAFSFQIANEKTKEKNKVVETAATPVSGKTIVVDAGHE